jgi:hypothetical protein
MEAQAIEFHTMPHLLGKIPQPIPASRAVPEWYRKMPQQKTPELSTVKRCMPFLDALTAGYLIPIVDRAHIALSEAGEFKIESVVFDPPLVEVHSRDQFPGAPFPEVPALKFNSPWVIRTPPGYSTLFVSPLNRIELPILPLSGIVDTDTFYIPISFPVLYLLGLGTELEIPRGTPLVQAIPFKRDGWASTFGAMDNEKFGMLFKALQENRGGFYKDGHWQKKSFT